MFFTSARSKNHLGVICGGAPARALAGCQGQAQGRILLGWEFWPRLSCQRLINALCVWGVAVRASGGRELHSQHGIIKMFHFIFVTPGGQGEF